MANIRTHPNEWNKLLDALDADDLDKARKIVIKHDFGGGSSTTVLPDGRRVPRTKYTYYCKSPSPGGTEQQFARAADMAEFIDTTADVIWTQLNKKRTGHTWKRGPLEGWSMWRERV